VSNGTFYAAIAGIVCLLTLIAGMAQRFAQRLEQPRRRPQPANDRRFERDFAKAVKLADRSVWMAGSLAIMAATTFGILTWLCSVWIAAIVTLVGFIPMQRVACKVALRRHP
jgi:hypothetical protein